MVQRISKFIKSKFKSIEREKLLINFALLPLFFNWLLVLSNKEISEQCRKYCLYSGIFSFYFFILFGMSFIISLIPFIGNFLGNVVHLFAVLVYFGLTGIFIYSFSTGKKIEISFVQKNFLFLNEILK